MTPRMLPAAFLFLATILIVPALAAPLYQGGVQADSYTWVRDAEGAYRLEYPDGRELGVTGQPDLPGRDLLLLVPADLAVVDVRVEPLSVREEPLPGRLALAPALVSSSGEVLPRHHLEPQGDAFPATWGRFGGLQTWRGYRLLAVNLHPFRVVGTGDAARLQVLERFAVHAVTDGGRTPDTPLQRRRLVPGERRMLEAALSRLVDNPDRLAAYPRQDGIALDKSGDPFLPSPMPSLEGSAVRYLVVTTEALADEFQRLADHRTAQGLPAAVVTTEWIKANYRRGADEPETIRFFLQEAYGKWGMEYLLIGGDTELVPTRMIRSTFYPYGGHTDIPTDLYYAGLDGSWAADGDGWYGEPYVSLSDPGDAADMAPEVAVGRAPVRDAVAASQFVDKVLQYESATSADGWPNRILYAAEVLFPADWHPGDQITLDGAQYSNTLVDDYILGCAPDMEYVRMHETDALWPRDAPLSRAALIDSLNTGHYGQVNQFGHGHFFNMSVGDANFTVSDASALTNPNYFMLFAINCASGAFDVSCLLERFVQNPRGGAIMSVGAAREAFPSNSFGYQEITYDYMLCGGKPRTAVAFNAARMDYISNTERNTIDRWTQLNAVIIGDPATTIWCGTPRVPEIDAPTEVSVGEQTITVTVTANVSPVVGADVCLQKEGETYAFGVTDMLGQVQLTVIPSTAGDLDLTVSGKGLEPTTTTIDVLGSDTYVSLTDWSVVGGSGNGNGVIEAGETIWLSLDFEDVGGGGATGLTALISSNDPDLDVLTASVPMADCSPGGVTSTLENVVVRVANMARDGDSLPLHVEVTDGAESWASVTNLPICAPEPEMVRLEFDDAAYGNGDGVIDDGERVVLQPIVKNFGSGLLDQLIIQVVDAQPGVTVYSPTAVLTDLPALSESGPDLGEISIALDDVDMLEPCGLVFTDNYDRPFAETLQFRSVTAPPAPATDATIAPDAIALRWDPVTDTEILGYNIYRAESAEGPFVKANADLIEGMSYYQDRDLAQLTFYWYKITAVDVHFMESDYSGVTAQTTMPAELENFPLPFAVQTSGHAAVGDIDADGRPEIVLASDEVYAWNDDGSELVDGDDDAQTTGPLTNVDGEFGPAGVALADLDGEEGLEIIASERSAGSRIMVYKADGTLLPGWPRAMQSSWNWATPSAGDVDGDGDLEVVVNDLGGRLFVWHHDGTELRDGDDDPSTDGIFIDRPDSWTLSSPAIHDIDDDGAGEIIYGTRVYDNQNALLAFKSDGTQARGFPFATGYDEIICSPAVADVDWDGQHEIIFFTTDNDLYVLRSDGELYPGFPVHYDSVYDDSPGPSPAVGNFDDDPDLEIVWPVNAGSFRMDLLVVDTDVDGGTSGDIMPGWPVQLPANTEGSPVVGDLDGDGVADIIQPIGSSETETPDLVMGFDAQGQTLAGFPISLGGHCRSTPVICDLDLDGDTDLVYGSWDLQLHVWDLPAPYDPRVIPWATFQGNPARDGRALQLSYTPVAEELPQAFTVMPPHPNPFNPVTSLRLYVTPGRDTRLDVAVFDLRGRLVRRLHRGEAQPGWHEFTWDGRDGGGRTQASGVYFMRARQGGEARTHKMTLVK